jgi:hypothetical protein
MSATILDCTKCGAILTEHIATVTCGNSCNECGKYAYAADEPSYLYLLTNVQLGLHKVGIGTVGQDKNYLQQLIQSGWKVHSLWHAVDKGQTFQWEKEVFKQLQAQFDSAGASGFIGRSDRHWFDSVSAEAISITSLSHLMSTVVSGGVK